MIHDGDAERTALDRIGARAHFVEQHERRRRERTIHRRDVRDVRGERAEARFDRLFVADIREDRSEDRQPRSVSRRNAQPRLRHHRQEPCGFQRDGLAAGVRPGHQQDRRGRNHFDGDRHRMLDQRVPGGLQLEGAVGREHRFDAVDRLRETRAPLQDIEVGRRLDGAVHVRPARAERVGERQQNAPHLFRLLLLQRDNVVVDLDGAERLQEQAGSAGRRAVDDPRNRAALLGLDDEHIAAVALGHHLILQVLRRLLAAQVRLERAAQAGALLPQPVPKPFQRGARIVHHVAGRVDLVARLSGFTFEGCGSAAGRFEDWK